MVEVDISPNLIRKAAIKSKKIGVLRNSITRGKGNIYGVIGEFIVAEYLEAKVKNTFDFDLIKNQSKLDVKTKTCSSEPKMSYECSIAAANIKQECDFYVFVRVHNNMHKAWILGGISKKNFFKKATFRKKDEEDPSSKFGWKFKADCYNLKISQLIKIEKFLEKI